MPKNSRRLFGFTLIELLVVISIIGILMAIGAVSYSGTQKKARDTRRRAEMKAVQNAMEMYAANNNGVYIGCTDVGGVITVNGTVVREPVSGDYTCVFTAASNTYCACALLDETTKGNSTNSACAGIGGATGTHYCVQQLQ